MAVWKHEKSASKLFGLEIWLTFVACLSCQRGYALEDFEQKINSLSPAFDDGGTEIKSANNVQHGRANFFT